MLEKLRLVEERYMEMEERAAQPDFYADPKAATKLLKEQNVYSKIVEKTGASTATISRVNRSLQYGANGYDIVFERLEQLDGKL